MVVETQRMWKQMYVEMGVRASNILKVMVESARKVRSTFEVMCKEDWLNVIVDSCFQKRGRRIFLFCCLVVISGGLDA